MSSLILTYIATGLVGVVAGLIVVGGIAIPADSWPRVRKVFSDVTRNAEDEITAQSRLFDDLGFA